MILPKIANQTISARYAFGERFWGIIFEEKVSEFDSHKWESVSGSNIGYDDMEAIKMWEEIYS